MRSACLCGARRQAAGRGDFARLAAQVNGIEGRPTVVFAVPGSARLDGSQHQGSECVNRSSLGQEPACAAPAGRRDCNLLILHG